jgi:hypothetical protein
MLKPRPAPSRPAQPPEAIRTTYAGQKAAARLHSPFGVLSKTDQDAILRRTAQLCGVTVAEVIEATK